MPSSNNLAQFFAQQQQNDGASSSSSVQRPSITIPRSSKSPSPSSYNPHSKAVDAEDDDHFEKSTFLLKRTRSVGLLDEFIAPTKKLIEEGQNEDQNEHGVSDDDDDEDEEHYDIDYDESTNSNTISNRNSNNNNNNNSYHNNHLYFNDDNDNDDENQFIEDVNDETYNRKENNSKQLPSYAYTDDEYSYSSYDNDEEEIGSMSPSPPDTPDLYQPHDDNDIVYEPQRHVDYLSHNWKEADISKSWRYIVLKRKDVANSARLENASWRTWAQAKYRLKTVSPESVNWLKDSDVTWLYGPLYKEPKNFQPANNDENNNDENDKKYGSDSESTPKHKNTLKQPGTAEQKQKIKGPKPILKKRTVSEMLSQPSMIRLPPHRHRGHSPIIESGHHQGLPSPPHIEDDFDMISSKINAQYKKHPLQQQHDLQQKHQELQEQEAQVKEKQKSKSQQIENNEQQQSNLPRNGSSMDSIPKKEDFQNKSSAGSPATSTQQPPQKRHIHFNDRVEQCIAVNIPDSDEEEFGEDYEGDEEDDVNESDSESDDDEGGFFLQVRSPSTPQIHNKEFLLPLSKNEQNCLTKPGEYHTSRYQTIELLPCTTLKHGSDEEYEDSDDYDAISDKYAVSHNVNTSRGFNYYYDYNSVYPSDQNLIPHVHLGDNEYEIDANTQHLEGIKMVDVPENIVMGSNVEIEDTPSFANPASDQDHIENSKSMNEQQQQQQQQSHTKLDGGVKSSGGSFVLHSDDEDSEREDEEEQESEQQPQPQKPQQQPPQIISPTPSSSSSTSSKNLGENLTRVSSSPSYASLSDVAAQGYISQSPSSNQNNLSDVISKNYSPNSTNNRTNETGSPSSSKNNEEDGNENVSGGIDGKNINELQKSFGNLNSGEEKTGFKHTFLNSFKRS